MVYYISPLGPQKLGCFVVVFLDDQKTPKVPLGLGRSWPFEGTFDEILGSDVSTPPLLRSI